MAHPATQNGQNTGLMRGEAIPELPTPSEGLVTGSSLSTGRVPVCMSTKHTVSVLRITLYTTERVRQGEWWGCELGQVLSSNPIRA